MKIYNKVIAFAAAITLLTACDKDVFDINSDPFKGQSYNNELLLSPISTFLTEQNGFGEYVKLLRYAGMFDALNQSTAGVKFTAFVPNDDAMQEFYQRRGVSSMEELGKAYARQFVLYHTVNTDSILPEKFVQLTSVTNLTGDELSVEIDSEHAGEATLNGEGRVVEMGLSAFNGKIYVLSSAMTPLVETAYDRVVEAGNFNIMQQALVATGWDEKLSIIVDTPTIRTISVSSLITTTPCSMSLTRPSAKPASAVSICSSPNCSRTTSEASPSTRCCVNT